MNSLLNHSFICSIASNAKNPKVFASGFFSNLGATPLNIPPFLSKLVT